MAKKMKKNSSVHKVSQRAIEEREEKERIAQEEAEKKEKQKKIKEQNQQNMKDAIISSVGGLLTLVSLLVGLYGLISIPAIVCCVIGYKKNADYGWRGKLIPVICIVLNVLWIFFQVIIIVSPEIRLWVYNLLYPNG